MKIIKKKFAQQITVYQSRLGNLLGERFSTLCNNCQIGDEFQFILECDKIQNIRKYFLYKYIAKNIHRANVNSLKKCTFTVKIYDPGCPS